MHLEVRKGNMSGQFYVRLVGGNGEVMMFSEIYDSKSNAVRAANNIANNWPDKIEVLVDERP